MNLKKSLTSLKNRLYFKVPDKELLNYDEAGEDAPQDLIDTTSMLQAILVP